MAALFLVFIAPVALAQATYSTGFEPPEFVLGDVNGQNGWGHLSNSPTGGTIEVVPAGSPPMFGTQSLAVRTRNVDFFGVVNHLFSPQIDPAGENGSVTGTVVVPDPRTHFAATLWVHTPPAPVISTRSDGRLGELNPSSKGSGASDPSHRYAQVRIYNSTNTAAGLVRVEIGWYQTFPSGFTVAVVADDLQWNQWYRFDYLLELIDGTNGPEPNDRFTLTIFDLAGNQLGSECGSTWEMGWKSGTFDGNPAARAINGFDFASLSGPNGSLLAHIDEMSMETFDAEALEVAIDGGGGVCPGGTVTLTANPTGGATDVTGYEWRDGDGNIIGTEATIEVGAGTYTVTAIDALCVRATSDPVTITSFSDVSVSITGDSTPPPNTTSTLTANVTGGSGTISSYEWRNTSTNTVVGTGPTYEAGPGTYTVTVTDQSCGTATSDAFVVTPAPIPATPTASQLGLLVLLCAVVGAAVGRLR